MFGLEPASPPEGKRIVTTTRYFGVLLHKLQVQGVIFFLNREGLQCEISIDLIGFLYKITYYT